jgi:hypothetical protein
LLFNHNHVAALGDQAEFSLIGRIQAEVLIMVIVTIVRLPRLN